MAEIWAEVLHIKRIGAADNFFELGGHSLLATQVIARISKYLEVDIQMRSLFEDPTVAGVAAAVEGVRPDGRIARPRITPGRSEEGKRELLERQLRELSEDDIDALLKAALAGRSQAWPATD